MELHIAGTNLAITPETQSYIEHKVEKLNRHKPDILDIKLEISEEGTKSPLERFLVRVTIQSGSGGAVVHGEERAQTVFLAVDRVVDMMARQLERSKGKLYHKRGSQQARGKFVETPPEEKKIVKRKRFPIEPMSTGDAIAQMESLGHSFFLYLDADADEARLLYRRNDGNYGVIEPELHHARD